MENVLKVKRAADFSQTGEYEVSMGELKTIIYRSPDDSYWYELRPFEHYSTCCIGFNKIEAIATITKRFNEGR